MADKIILTGIKPTGSLHLGNYVGAIKPFFELARENKNTYLFVADYHALNALYDAKEVRNNTLEMSAAYLAFGLNVDNTVFYRQSDVPELFEIATLLNNVTPKGLMDRAHAYKASVDKNREAGNDVDLNVNMGLYNYPILMAADILAAGTDIVPVGKDQVQHVEFARDMAGYFNNTYKKQVFKLPEYKLSKDAEILPGIDGRKMSKSYNNYIALFGDSAQRRKSVMKIVTDSKLPDEPKDADSNIIFQLYRHFASEAEIAEMRNAFAKGGMGYGDAKKMLFEVLERVFAEPSERYAEYISKPKLVEEILMAGAAKIRPRARETLSLARETVGFAPLP